MSGWIKIMRDHLLSLSKLRSDRYKTLMHLWASALWKPGPWEHRWGIEQLERGELMCSERGLAADLNISYDKIRTILKDLEQLGEISRTKTALNQRIKVVNYDAFCNSDKGPIGELDRTDPALNPHSLYKDEEGKKVRKKKELLSEAGASEPVTQPVGQKAYEDLKQQVTQKRQVELQAHQKLTLVYKILMGVDVYDREWDRKYFPRFARQAKDMLDLFRGDWEAASVCAKSLAREFDNRGLTWTPETLMKHAGQWIAKNGGIQNVLTKRVGVGESKAPVEKSQVA